MHLPILPPPDRAPVETGAGQLLASALQRNPVVALATAVVGTLVGLFRRRRSSPATIEKLKLESYRSQPLPPAPGRDTVSRPTTGGLPMDNRSTAEPKRIAGHRPPPTRSARTTLKLGGSHHG